MMRKQAMENTVVVGKIRGRRGIGRNDAGWSHTVMWGNNN